MITYSNVLEKTATLNISPIEFINDICIQFNCYFSLNVDNFVTTDIGYCRISLLDIDKLLREVNSSSITNDLSKHAIYILKEIIVNDIDTKTLAIIDIINIEDDYRGKGFGSNFLNRINDYLINLNIGVNAVGLISGWKNKDNTWLNNFYKLQGFDEYSKTKDNRSLMIKRLII